MWVQAGVARRNSRGTVDALTRGMLTKFSAAVFALALSGCGGDKPSHQAPDITSFITQDAPITVAPTRAPVAIAVKVEQPKPLPTKFDDALAQGRELAKKGDRTGAKEMFESAIKLDKKKADPHLEL